MVEPAGAVRAAGLALGLLCLGACRSFFPPSQELCELLRARAADERGDLRALGHVRIESEHLRGEYQAAVALHRGAEPKVRVQWFPELGGKVLDLYASRERIAGSLPAAGQQLDLAPDAPAPAYQPLLLMGISLLESFLPVVPERVLDARRAGSGHELRLRSQRPWLRLRALVDDQGAVQELRFDHLGARWLERRDPDGKRRVLEAVGFRMEILLEETEPTEELPEAVFEWNQGSPGRP